MGFESTTFLKLVQCSDYQLSYEATQLGEGQFFGSCVPVKGLNESNKCTKGCYKVVS